MAENENLPPFYVCWYWKFYVEDDLCAGLHPSGREMPDFTVYYGNIEHWLEPTFILWSAMMAIFLLVGRLALAKFVLTPLSSFVVHEKTPQNIQRFNESCAKFVFYSIAWCYSCYIVTSKPFYNNPVRLMDEAKLHSLDKYDQDILPIYYLEMGWYLQALFTHFLLDTKKKDDFMMVLHHIVTLLLIFASYKVNYIEYGLLVLYSMDLCDVFLEFMRFLRLGLDTNGFVEVLIFLPLPLSWLYFRIIFFYNEILFHSLFYVPVSKGWNICKLYWPFNILLSILFILNLIWFSQILTIAYKKVFLGVQLDDDREMKNDTKKKKKKKNKKKKSN